MELEAAIHALGTYNATKASLYEKEEKGNRRSITITLMMTMMITKNKEKKRGNVKVVRGGDQGSEKKARKKCTEMEKEE